MKPPLEIPLLALPELAAAVGGEVVAASQATAAGMDASAVSVRGITHDSRRVSEGMVFCCVVGRHHDGHNFAFEAIQAGAAALLVQYPLDVAVPQVVVPDVRRALGPASAEVWDHPWNRCTLVGVTGTAGKTTVTHAIGTIAQACGTSCEVIGTLDGHHTTPEAPDLYQRISAAADAGADLVVLEVSSHALSHGRVDGAQFDAGVFTNLSHEHLDFHGTMDEYFAAKARLFDGRSDIAVINVADEWGRRLATIAASSTPTVIHWKPDDVTDVEVSQDGLSGQWRRRPFRCGLLGRVNVSNIAAAATTASVLGFDDDDIASAIAAITPVPGRLWPVNSPADDITVLVDFAHKPQALAAALQSARELGSPHQRLWAVVGAGGDRDRAKRAPMGAAADRLADVVVITSDNPRSEDPAEIAAQIAAGIEEPRASGPGLHIELDRARAISLAVEQAQPGDVVVIAGKGHETAQVSGDQAMPFDDAAVAADMLRKRRSPQQ